MNYRFALIWIFAMSALVACEPRFTGDRDVNTTALNAPMQMHLVTLSGVKYLAVMNSNYDNRYDNATLQFFSLATPSSPVRAASLSIQLPSLASDFYYDDGASDKTLYILDRSKNQLLVYSYTNGGFSAKRDARGNPIQISLLNNPQRIIKLTGTASYGDIFVILCQSVGAAGTLMFLQIANSGTESTDYSFVPTAASIGTKNVSLFAGRMGAAFYVNARQTISGTDDRVTIGGADQEGYGINELVGLGGANELVATIGMRSPVLFSYQVNNLWNASNFVWDLGKYREGFSEAGVGYYGSGKYGFRGLAKDDSGNLYMSSIADERIYRISSADLALEKVAPTDITGRNTTGYGEGSQTNSITVTPPFDDNTTDNIFPRLGSLLTDCPSSACTTNGGTPTRLWVLGMGSNRVYRVALSTPSVGVMTKSEAVLSSPQQLLWDSATNLLYIANAQSYTISVIDGDSLLPTGIGEIPTVN